MEIPVNGYRCVSEEVFEGQVIHGVYGVASGSVEGRSLEFKVFDEDGNELLANEITRSDTKSKYALTPDDDGDLDLCFIDATNRRSLSPIIVTLEIHTGFNTKNPQSLAGKEKITHTEELVDEAHRSAYHILEYLQECQKIEFKRRDINEATNSRTLWFSIIIIIAVVVLTFWQIRSLKSYFIRRKLI
ncbi:Transmembrane protein tmp21 [Entamoeba marina]